MLMQTAPFPTERSMIARGVAQLRSGVPLGENERAVMLRWIGCVPDDLVEKVLERPAMLRLVESSEASLDYRPARAPALAGSGL